MKRRGLAPSKSRGFTLIELLVVIAIIGILATIILVNLQSGRKTAQATAVLALLKTIQTNATLCNGGGGTLLEPTSATAGGGSLCNPASLVSAATWPSISSPGSSYPYWKYLKKDAPDRPTGIGNFTSDANSFTLGAYKTDQTIIGTSNPNWYIKCVMSGCTKSGF